MEKIVTSTNDEQYYHCCCCRNDWCWFHNPEKLTRSLSWLTEAHGADSPSSIWKTTRLHTPRVVMWVDYRVSTQNATESLNGPIRRCWGAIPCFSDGHHAQCYHEAGKDNNLFSTDFWSLHHDSVHEAGWEKEWGNKQHWYQRPPAPGDT